MSHQTNFRVLNGTFFHVNPGKYADSPGIYASKENVLESQQTHLLPKGSPLKVIHNLELTQYIPIT